MSPYKFRNLLLCLVPCSWSWDMLDAMSSTQIPDNFKLSNPKARAHFLPHVLMLGHPNLRLQASALDLHGPFDPASSGSKLHGEEL
ncbi:hypothetical protein C8Q76DRAFT_707413, partial [Earliella scabrosa]